MKKICFLASHQHSGSAALFSLLEQNPRVQGFRLGRPYRTLEDVQRLLEMPHKLDTTAAVYLDELLTNPMLQSKRLYSFCKFIYLVRRPADTLGGLVCDGYKPGAACRYYCYRLRRLGEMVRRTPGAVFLTWEDVVDGRGLAWVERYLNLKQALGKWEGPAVVPWRGGADLLREAEASYERLFLASRCSFS